MRADLVVAGQGFNIHDELAVYGARPEVPSSTKGTPSSKHGEEMCMQVFCYLKLNACLHFGQQTCLMCTDFSRFNCKKNMKS